MNVAVYRKVGTVLAQQAVSDGSVTTPEGVMSYKAGDYLVTDNPPTHVWPVKREVFLRTYMPAVSIKVPDVALYHAVLTGASSSLGDKP